MDTPTPGRWSRSCAGGVTTPRHGALAGGRARRLGLGIRARRPRRGRGRGRPGRRLLLDGHGRLDRREQGARHPGRALRRRRDRAWRARLERRQRARAQPARRPPSRWWRRSSTPGSRAARATTRRPRQRRPHGRDRVARMCLWRNPRDRRHARGGRQLELAPLIVREPLAEHLAEHLPGERARSSWSGSARGTRTSPTSSAGAASASCCAARRARRCRRAPTTCCASGACWTRSRTPMCAPRARCSPAPTSRVIGAPFYVMEYVEGTVITTDIPEPLDTPAERRRIGLDLVDALVEMHAVDWRACGLEGFGKPTGYLERQLRGSTDCGRSTRPASYRACRRWATGSRPTCRTRRRRPSCTATTGSATRWSPTTRPRA